MKILKHLVNIIYPSLCLSCNKSLSVEEALFCEGCLRKLPLIKAYCKRCGSTLNETLVSYFSPDELTYCGFCVKKPPYYDKVFLGFNYEDPIKDLILKAKFQENYVLAYQLGRLLRRVLNLSLGDYDYCLSIPLSQKRAQERGYNQSLLLLWGFSGLKFPYPIIRRIKHTKPQFELTPKERLENVKGAFEVKGKLDNKRILLVDDVLTTGATVNEASKMLKKAGAKIVHLLILARA
ncbi:MAG: ComF family protein [Caldimicrobium sp.]|nr:ComF family protein [Caldimicrobium sp.]MCX7874360.1 ComF family protein [Caldimicrobium sp.]MDW8093486.1 ComF family protein [Caldimicrobium sp.]